MLAKPLHYLYLSCMKLIASIFWILYLHLLLWSTFLRAAIDIEEKLVPISFFFLSKQTTCVIRVKYNEMTIYESMFFATIALVGYYHASAGMVSLGVSKSTLAKFEVSMMGVQQKYYWMCYVPWIVTFGQNWLQNVVEFLILLSSDRLYQANDFIVAIVVLVLFFSVQAMLASEVFFMTLQGWYAMKNINDENILWEQRKKILLDTRIQM